MHQILEFISKHEGVSFLLGTAFISTMPAKDSPFNWRTLYGWIHDGLTQYLNLRRPMPPADPPPAKPQP